MEFIPTMRGIRRWPMPSISISSIDGGEEHEPAIAKAYGDLYSTDCDRRIHVRALGRANRHRLCRRRLVHDLGWTGAGSWYLRQYISTGHYHPRGGLGQFLRRLGPRQVFEP